MSRAMLAGIVLVIVVSLFRLLPVFLGVTTEQPHWLFNFSPMAALCLCGAAMLPRRWAISLPLFALLATDLILTAHYGHPLFNVEFFAKTVAFALIAAFGWMLRGNAKFGVMLPAAVGSSLFFYLVTNTASWIYDPAYVKNLAGWAQAMTTGLPQFPPTWRFYQNTFVSDVVFTVLFLLCVRPADKMAAREKAAAAW
jgi:hypothetical protein